MAILTMHRWEVLLPGVPITTNLGFLGLCNVVLLTIDDRYAIFDPGHYGNREPLLSALSSKGLGVKDIDYVILSHLHFDHALNATLFPNAQVIVSRNEVEYARTTSNDPYVVPYLIDLLKDRIRYVSDGDEFLGARFVLLPGHTGGTMGLLLEDKTLLVGDAIKYVSEALSGRATFTYYSNELANESIMKALGIARVIVPGHDMPFTINGKSIKPLTNEPFNFQLTLKGHLRITLMSEHFY